jgi:hypothetical protein
MKASGLASSLGFSTVSSPTSKLYCACQAFFRGYESHGLSSFTGRSSTSRTLRVTRVRPWTIAVAANRVSTTGRVRPAANSPHRRATARSTSKILPAKLASTSSDHSKVRSDLIGSVSFTLKAPLRISPNVRTLRYSAELCRGRRKSRTSGSGSLRPVSESTLVSSRNRSAELTGGLPGRSPDLVRRGTHPHHQRCPAHSAASHAHRDVATRDGGIQRSTTQQHTPRHAS